MDEGSTPAGQSAKGTVRPHKTGSSQVDNEPPRHQANGPKAASTGPGLPKGAPAPSGRRGESGGWRRVFGAVYPVRLFLLAGLMASAMLIAPLARTQPATPAASQPSQEQGGEAVAVDAATPELQVASSAGAKELPPDAENEPPFPPAVLTIVIILLLLSAFFSGSETAFTSLHKIRLRALSEEQTATGPLIARMMDNPAELLTTILVGNALVNVLIGVSLGGRMDILLGQTFASFGMSDYFDVAATSYVLAVLLTTGILVFFGEVLPKVIAVTAPEKYARVACIPLYAADWLLSPLRQGSLWVTSVVFRVTRFSELQAAPFITDDELKAVLFDTEQKGLIPEEDLQMIEGILDFTDKRIREILTPRPDVIAINADASIDDALAMLREHEHSRMPVYQEDLDHVIGVLVIKDVLPRVARGEVHLEVRRFCRKAFFVPETMPVHEFVKFAQRRRTHLAVAVDEYGGTAGIVTLEDALEEVVGDIFDEGEVETSMVQPISDTEFRIDGGISLEELTANTGFQPEEETEHNTISGFLMEKAERVLIEGDAITVNGGVFTVEQMEGHRVVSLHMALVAPSGEEQDTEEAAS